MPEFRSRAALNIFRSLGVYYDIALGAYRGQRQDRHAGETRLRGELEQARAEIKRLRSTLRQSADTKEQSPSGLDPSNVVWIFGTGRGGSTWLMNMMCEMPGAVPWNEPKVGNLFGEFYESSQQGERNARNYIFGDPLREEWTALIRAFVLGSIDIRRPSLGRNAYVVVKEPNASVGAPLLSAALPESRLVFLIRDPRDVVASFLDAMRKGSWLYERRDLGKMGGESPSDTDTDSYVEELAREYMRGVEGAGRAFDSHPGPKSLVRYEDLRTDTVGELKRLYEELGIPCEEGFPNRVAEKYDWESIPKDERGEGKKLRKAAPGSWEEDLTPLQVAAVERIAEPALTRYYV